jgi:hypothetical protein
MKDEALKLAFALDYWATQMDMGRKPDPKSLIRKASAELRRLQAELDAIKQAPPAQPAPVQPVKPSLWEQYHAAQPALVQEHVATLVEHYAFTDGIVRFDGVENMEQLPVGTKFYTTPPAQPAPVQEPVATVIKKGADRQWMSERLGSLPDGIYSLYPTAPVQQAPVQPVPLTDEQIESLLPDDDTPMSLGEAFVRFARLVEAHHGITKGQP